MHLTYVALHEVAWGMAVWCTQNTPRRQLFHVSRAMPAGMPDVKLVTHLESRARAVSVHDSGEQRYAKAINDNNNHSRGPRKRLEDVFLVEFRCLVFTRIPVESYRRLLRSLLLYLCYVFRALINSLLC